jgi:hypothetical protein
VIEYARVISFIDNPTPPSSSSRTPLHIHADLSAVSQLSELRPSIPHIAFLVYDVDNVDIVVSHKCNPLAIWRPSRIEVGSLSDLGFFATGEVKNIDIIPATSDHITDEAVRGITLNIFAPGVTCCDWIFPPVDLLESERPAVSDCADTTERRGFVKGCDGVLVIKDHDRTSTMSQ